MTNPQDFPSRLISGPVIRGDQIGRKLGFPTANIGVDRELAQVLAEGFPEGVYAAVCSISSICSISSSYSDKHNKTVRPKIDSWAKYLQDINYSAKKIEQLKLDNKKINNRIAIYANQSNLDHKSLAKLLQNQLYPGLLHFGKRSTFGEYIPKWELHILNFDADIYGCELNLLPLVFQRGSVKYEGEQALIHQMQRDREQALDYFLSSM